MAKPLSMWLIARDARRTAAPKACTKHRNRPGDQVPFRFDGHYTTSIVNRITKRAAIRVLSAFYGTRSAPAAPEGNN